MPTTTYTDATFAVAAIGARTDSSGVAVADYTAEEARLLSTILSEGYLSSDSSFQVAAQAVPNMSVKVGSGSAKADVYVVAGETAGQGNYLTRLDASSVTVTVPAADASQARTDEVYLVVRDNAYDASSRGLPQLGYRKGDAGGSAPGPDSNWKASVKLATIAVGAAVSTITSGNITDNRVPSQLAVAGGSYPRGLIAWGKRTTNSTATTGSTQSAAQKVLEVSANVKAGRLYRVYAKNVGAFSTTSALVELALVYTNDGSTPSVSSSYINKTVLEVPSGAFVISADMEGFYAPGSDQTLKVLLTIFRVSGTNSVSTFGNSEWPASIAVEDIGAAVANSQTLY